MKDHLKKWLGISILEARVGKPEESTNKNKYLWLSLDWFDTPRSLYERNSSLEKKVVEINDKIDQLEKYLEIEYFKQDVETKTYGWNDSSKTKGYRKTQPYEKVKKLKEAKTSKDEE